MIEAIEKNLQRGIKLLESINDEQYSDCTIPPYYSSIGNNMRHVLDIFSCIFQGFESGTVDFSDRNRNELAQIKTEHGIAYFNSIIEKLRSMKHYDFDQIITVCDDLGTGTLYANYTLGSALIQAHSHAIHHFASIGFLVYQLGVELPDSDFGYNPTTPKILK
ncbi:DinB family protein [Tenacibaculum sp. IB213877]|uniref:DinB family protein n=1 Tax=Tenacibaculum sp. IB213877 TaxID=3097351 RepID=UPI002A5A0352|nr:DinB family protein [Tenacibaculum sp. IB213877]MDY0779818.1 DinB family protein [Tenacibaculum sp. IB213877]